MSPVIGIADLEIRFTAAGASHRLGTPEARQIRPDLTHDIDPGAWLELHRRSRNYRLRDRTSGIIIAEMPERDVAAILTAVRRLNRLPRTADGALPLMPRLMIPADSCRHCKLWLPGDPGHLARGLRVTAADPGDAAAIVRVLRALDCGLTTDSPTPALPPPEDPACHTKLTADGRLIFSLGFAYFGTDGGFERQCMEYLLNFIPVCRGCDGPNPIGMMH